MPEVDTGMQPVLEEDAHVVYETDELQELCEEDGNEIIYTAERGETESEAAEYPGFAAVTARPSEGNTNRPSEQYEEEVLPEQQEDHAAPDERVGDEGESVSQSLESGAMLASEVGSSVRSAAVRGLALSTRQRAGSQPIHAVETLDLGHEEQIHNEDVEAALDREDPHQVTEAEALPAEPDQYDQLEALHLQNTEPHRSRSLEHESGQEVPQSAQAQEVTSFSEQQPPIIVKEVNAENSTDPNAFHTVGSTLLTGSIGSVPQHQHEVNSDEEMEKELREIEQLELRQM